MKRSKPKILCRAGVWLCFDDYAMGFGPDPVSAYNNWRIGAEELYFEGRYL